MKTLYDLLGALPHDDEEALRTAFRSAVKDAHPDIRPGEPSAALSIRPPDLAPPLASAASEARSLRARGMTAYRNGDLKRAIADLDHALRLDPKFLPAYIDRGIISYRQRKFGRAYADIARPPRRIEKATHSRSAPAKRPRIAQAGVPTWMAWSQAQTATQDPSHGDGFTSAMH